MPPKMTPFEGPQYILKDEEVGVVSKHVGAREVSREAGNRHVRLDVIPHHPHTHRLHRSAFRAMGV